jgi:signal transduction histidine kinase
MNANGKGYLPVSSRPGARFRARLVAGLALILLAVAALAISVGSAARENVAALHQSNEHRRELERIIRLANATGRYVTEIREALEVGERHPNSEIRTEFQIALAELERWNQVAPGPDHERDARQLAHVRASINALDFGLDDAFAASGEERAALMAALREEIESARDATLHARLEAWMDEKRSRTNEIEVVAETRAERLEMVATAAPALTAVVGLVLILVTVPRVGGELGKLKKAATALRRGDREARVELVGGDEFTEVGSAFNAMADELQRVTVAKSELEAAILELGNTRDQLLQAQKMEALGRIAGGLAHDFNNMLLVITASAEFIQQELGESSASLADVRDILDASGRASDLTHQLLELTRSRASRLEPVLLSELARDAHRMLARVLHDGIEIVTETPATWTAMVDRSQVEQVLMNLVINARDAIGASGRIVVEVRDVSAGAPETASSPTMSDKECVVLSVRDDGEGMSEEVRQRALEPFFTTKGPGAGSGLGLSTSYAIVNQAGGDFMIESREGEGTCIRLLFPRSPEISATVTERKGQCAEVPAGHRVMLVEDEPRARDATSRLLRSRGFEVQTAADGSAALGRLEDLGWEADVVVSDVRMPVMDGVELAHEIRQRRPELPVVLI